MLLIPSTLWCKYLTLLSLLAHLHAAQAVESCANLKKARPRQIAGMQGRCQYI